MRLFSFPEQMSDLPQLQMSFCKDILKGLAHLHDMLQVPLDLGARSCQVTQNLTIKVCTYMVQGSLNSVYSNHSVLNSLQFELRTNLQKFLKIKCDL